MKRGVTFSAAVLLLTACGNSRSVVSASPQPPIAIKATASASPTAPGQCSLPVFQQDPRTDTGIGSFVGIPNGTVRQDPSSRIVYEQGRSRTVSPPALHGGGLVATYDRPAARWVPVDGAAISQDGLHYAYGFRDPGQPNASQIRVVDISSGEERVAFTGPYSNGYQVVGFTGDGIYFTRAAPGSNGLWRLGPTTGNATQVTSVPLRWDDAGGGAAWATQPNPQHPVLEQGGPVLDQLLRVDLSSGRTSTWLTLSGQFLVVIGVDGDGRPLVQSVTGTANRILAVTAPGAAKQIYSGPGYGATGFIQLSGDNAVVADQQRIWFGSQLGIYEYAGGTFTKVTDTIGLVAGTCQ